MRKMLTDERGMELVPPLVVPCLNRRDLGNKEVTLVHQVREYEVISYLFGGGVKPHVPGTVRATEVRGQLRFWWRAMRGGLFRGNLQAMKDQEDRIWGAASTKEKALPSKVEVTVRLTREGTDRQVYAYGGYPGSRQKVAPARDMAEIAYAAFPLQPDSGEPPGAVREGVGFSLNMVFPDSLRQEIEAALWAWETFGGIGARTRRGFGALNLLSVDGRPVQLPKSREVTNLVQRKIEQYVWLSVAGNDVSDSSKWPDGVPHISPGTRLKITGEKNNPKEAWKCLIRQLREFRQSRGGERPSARGRSEWPEADAIRTIFGRTKLRKDFVIEKFPRAVLGLPIVFHLKGENPEQLTLKGKRKDHERLASPLILRPIACEGGKAVGIAIVLDGTGLPPEGLMLDGKPDYIVKTTLTRSESQTIHSLSGDLDVLGAFLKTIR